MVTDNVRRRYKRGHINTSVLHAGFIGEREHLATCVTEKKPCSLYTSHGRGGTEPRGYTAKEDAWVMERLGQKFLALRFTNKMTDPFEKKKKTCSKRLSEAGHVT